MVVRLRKGPSGPIAETSSGQSVPLTAARWVDPATTAPLESQDGSESAPFATIGQAIIDLEVDAGVLGFGQAALYLSAGNYNAESAVWNPVNIVALQVIGLGPVANIGSFDVDKVQFNPAVITFENVGIPLGATGPAVTITGTSLFVNLVNSVLASIAGTGQLNLQGSLVGTVVGQNITAKASSFSDSLTLTETCELYGCHALGLGNITAGFIRLDGCFWNGTLSSASSIQLIDTYTFVNSGPSTVSAPGGDVEVFSSRLAGDVSANTINIDTVSYQNGLTGGVTFTPALALAVTDLPISATVSILVPIVAAGAVGYVNTTLVGTPLENIFSGANLPITVNPQTDLVAAGAGGGFLNARISAANTLRSTFIGPLAGGAANFTVTRGR